MAQPVKLYACYAPADETAFKKLQKHLRPLEITGKIQFWHRGLITPGDNHAQKILTHLDQAQVVIVLVSSNFFESEHYDSVETQHLLQLHQEEKTRVIPVILHQFLWDQTFLGALVPLPNGGKPIRAWSKEDMAWGSVAESITGLVTSYISKQIEQESDLPIGTTKARRKSRKPARTKPGPLSGTALTVKSLRPSYTPRVTRADAPLKPDLPNHEQLFEEPEPVTAEARTATPAYDQGYRDLQNKINQIIFKILVWEPAQPSHGIVAEERRAIYSSLEGEQHQCWLGKDLQVPPGTSLQDREIEQARDTDLTVLLVESPAIGEMHEFCDHYDDDLFNKTICFYPEEMKSTSGNWSLDETIFEGYHLHYYQAVDITNCHVRTKVLNWVQARRGCRYRMQRRSGR